MEESEKLYRETSPEHKKYALRLTNYVEYLISKEKFLEADFFFKELFSKKPNHIKIINLGYQISIATFNNEGVKYFDKKLYDLNAKNRDIEINKLRLNYYLSIGSVGHAEECCMILLSKKIDNKTLGFITEVCVDLDSFKVLVSLTAFMKKNRLALANSESTLIIKRIAIKQLMNTLKRISYE